MPANQVIIDEAGVNTFSNASQQTLYSRAMEPNVVGWARAIVCARRVSDGAGKNFVVDAAFKRQSGGLSVHSVDVTTYGSTSDLNALSACAATIDAVGNDLLVRVEGLASTEIDWSTVVRGIATVHEAA
jgi:hypothetical protein